MSTTLSPSTSLESGDRRAKTDAIDAFTSQIRPLGTDPADREVLPPAVRRRFERTYELFFLGAVEG